jgi:hypothetical protein
MLALYQHVHRMAIPAARFYGYKRKFAPEQGEQHGSPERAIQ